MPDQRFWMTAKFNSKCHECTDEIRQGDRIVYDPSIRKAYCGVCGPDVLGDDPTNDDEEF